MMDRCAVVNTSRKMIDRPALARSFFALTALLSLSLSTGCQTMPKNSDLQAPLDTLSGNRPAGTTLLLDREFQQGWRASPEVDFEPARVRLYRGPDAFYVYAVLADCVMGNTATGFNEKTWESGDVFEIFIQTGADTYYEFHVTPENRNLFLAWTTESFAEVKEGVGRLEDALIDDPSLIDTATKIHGEEEFWTVSMKIPYSALGLDSTVHKPALKIAFARYDRSGAEGSAVLSATPNFSKPDFHDRDAWHPIQWGRPDPRVSEE